MNLSDIATAYVLYVNTRGGKRRPVFIIEDEPEKLTFYRITTKFAKKSATIQRQYFKITDLKAAGLNKQSWIDVGNPMIVAKSRLGNIQKIGHLSSYDEKGLSIFLDNFLKQQ